MVGPITIHKEAQGYFLYSLLIFFYQFPFVANLKQTQTKPRSTSIKKKILEVPLIILYFRNKMAQAKPKLEIRLIIHSCSYY